MWRLVGLGALVLLALSSPLAARTAGAAQKQNELTIDVGAASIGVTHAWRELGARLGLGGGGAIGLSPLPPLGATYATGTHFDYPGHLEFGEVLHAMLFARFEPTSWLRVDGGVRGGVFLHGGEKVSGGPFAGVFLAPALAWRWLWIGPRISGNWLWEETGERAGILVIEYVMLRFVLSW